MIRMEVGCVFMGLFMCISGVLGQSLRICASEGSTVNLTCTTENKKAKMRWYTLNKRGRKKQEIFAEGHHDKYNISGGNHPTLMINNVRESDEGYYCCVQKAKDFFNCWSNRILLHVTVLQVKVIPATEGQKVTLMCSTSCPLTESPSAFIWYKNAEFLYEDWSPWYQQLVSSDKAVRYSCAVKGDKDFRAPEVSVDSVTSTCFSVTYVKGKTCSYKHTSVDEPCSITYPRELNIQKTSKKNSTMLSCDTSCPLNESTVSYSWYRGGQVDITFRTEQSVAYDRSWGKGLTCAIKGNEDLISAEFCLYERNCWRVNYVSRRICALQGSSVNITSEYLHPSNQRPKYKHWYKLKNGRVEDAEMMTEAVDRVKFHDNIKNRHILEMKNLKKNDSAEYRFRLQQDDKEWRMSDIPGVKIIVTDLRVTFSPSAEVTEGQKVTLTCSTSCPLTDDANYIWYWNRRPLTQPENQNKHLTVDAVSIQHAGSYTCAVNILNIRSNEKTLTVHRKMGTWILAAAAGATAAFLIVIVLIFIFWIRRKKSLIQISQTETPSNMEQQNSAPLYENTPAPAEEQDDLLYSRIYFSNKHPDPLYSNIQPSHHQEQEDVQYSTVKFR
ncbi:uncharacterized protein LOC121507789 [Cheilinus undulatus]|uniref:uncharacterized protein LOC121507789 n=1 Tax=Cheilinus undulatus TaxID=241271 RepID=UPI001BD1FC8F|nr:uncharacterized protein LOC121507789 [Cheilinus undulatus]